MSKLTMIKFDEDQFVADQLKQAYYSFDNTTNVFSTNKAKDARKIRKFRKALRKVHNYFSTERL